MESADYTRRGLRVVVIFVGVGILAMVLLRLTTMNPPPTRAKLKKPPLPLYGQVSDFHFLNAQGFYVYLNDLKEHVWVADFIFTRCKGMGMRLYMEMESLQKEFPMSSGVRFVSFSIDAAHDSPFVLTQYIKSKKINQKQWFFLTGKPRKINAFLLQDFSMAVQRKKEPYECPGDLSRSNKFVLMDRKAQIRGVYAVSSGDQMARLRKDIKSLLKPGD